jgi:hypothetical protein
MDMRAEGSGLRDPDGLSDSITCLNILVLRMSCHTPVLTSVTIDDLSYPPSHTHSSPIRDATNPFSSDEETLERRLCIPISGETEDA